MNAPDHALLYEARRFITGANAHRVKTWIFCYETSTPDSAHYKRYEQLIREFVNTKKLLLGIRVQAKLEVKRGKDLRRASMALEEEIKRGS